MPGDDRFKKVSGAGADFVETARAKAEEFLRELARAGGESSKQAQDVLDELVVGGRKSTEQLIGAIRNEISNQLRSLGLATKDDLADLERRVTGRVNAAATTARAAGNAAATTRKAPARRASSPTGTAGKSTAAKKTAAQKTAAKKTTKRASATKKAAG